MKKQKEELIVAAGKRNEKLVKNRWFQSFMLILCIFCIGFSLAKSKTDAAKRMNWMLKKQYRELPSPAPIIQAEDNQYIETGETIKLSALSACLMDASTGRVLYGKDAFHEMPMASTTKIMTLLYVLENANLDDVVTVSSNAAKQPPVQLNINTGEQYVLRDLLYSLMLESHNDTAVAIAEHVGGSVENFCDLMTKRAKELGAEHTAFKTPNGLDADGHYTTARDLSLIASYAIQNEEFCKIVGTTTYQFDEVNRKRSFTVLNKDRFLYMMDGAIGIKTGYTGKAGYCFVGAIRIDGKTLVSTVLGSGWPPHKEYKWTDTKRLMNYGLTKYTNYRLSERMAKENMPQVPVTIPVYGGRDNQVNVCVTDNVLNDKLLFREDEYVTAKVMMQDYITAPTEAGTTVGYIRYYIGNNLYQELAIQTKEDADDIDFSYIFSQVVKKLF